MNPQTSAFPRSEIHTTTNGQAYRVDHAGMSLRAYFAAHAPIEPAPWFKPAMPCERPASVWDSPADLPGAVPSNWREQYEWDHLQQVAKVAQWPWAWADAVLAAQTGGAA